MARPENKRMQDFLKANGINCHAKFIFNGSLHHTWRLWGIDQKWTEELAAKLTDLGFTDFDSRPLHKFSGNGGAFSVWVRGHNELLGDQI